MSPNEEQFDELLSAYLDGELTPEEQQQVEDRLIDDEQYRRAFDELRSLRVTLQSLPRFTLGDDFRQRVIEAVDKAADSPSEPEPSEDQQPADTSPTPAPPPERGYRRGLAWSVIAITIFLAVGILQSDKFDQYIKYFTGSGESVVVGPEENGQKPGDRAPAGDPGHLKPGDPRLKPPVYPDNSAPVVPSTSIGPPPGTNGPLEPETAFDTEGGETVAGIEQPEAKYEGDATTFGGGTRGVDELSGEESIHGDSTSGARTLAGPRDQARGHFARSPAHREASLSKPVERNRVAERTSGPAGGGQKSGKSLKNNGEGSDNFDGSLAGRADGGGTASRPGSGISGFNKRMDDRVAGLGDSPDQPAQPAVVVVNLTCRRDAFNKMDITRLAAKRNIDLQEMPTTDDFADYRSVRGGGEMSKRRNYGYEERAKLKSRQFATSSTFIGQTTRGNLRAMLDDLSTASNGLDRFTVASNERLQTRDGRYDRYEKKAISPPRPTTAPVPTDTPAADPSGRGVAGLKSDAGNSFGARAPAPASASRPPVPGAAPPPGPQPDLSRKDALSGPEGIQGEKTAEESRKPDKSVTAQDDPDRAKKPAVKAEADDDSDPAAPAEPEPTEEAPKAVAPSDGMIAGSPTGEDAPTGDTQAEEDDAEGEAALAETAPAEEDEAADIMDSDERPGEGKPEAIVEDAKRLKEVYKGARRGSSMGRDPFDDTIPSKKKQEGKESGSYHLAEQGVGPRDSEPLSPKPAAENALDPYGNLRTAPGLSLGVEEELARNGKDGNGKPIQVLFVIRFIDAGEDVSGSAAASARASLESMTEPASGEQPGTAQPAEAPTPPVNE